MPTTPDPLSDFLSGLGKSVKRVASETKSIADSIAAYTNIGSHAGSGYLTDLRDVFTDIADAAHVVGARNQEDRAVELALQADEASKGQFITGEKVLQEAGEQLGDFKKQGKGKGKKKGKGKAATRSGGRRRGFGLPRHAR